MNLPQIFLERNVIDGSVMLHNGGQVPIDFYGDVYRSCVERIATLLPGLDYRAEHITGPNFWVPLPPTLARLAGRCVHDMAERKLLPMTVAPARGVTLRYRLR